MRFGRKYLPLFPKWSKLPDGQQPMSTDYWMIVNLIAMSGLKSCGYQPLKANQKEGVGFCRGTLTLLSCSRHWEYSGKKTKWIPWIHWILGEEINKHINTWAQRLINAMNERKQGHVTWCWGRQHQIRWTEKRFLRSWHGGWSDDKPDMSRFHKDHGVGDGRLWQ